MENKELPTEVILSDGRKVTKRRTKVRELAAAENQPKGKEHLSKYAMFAAKITIDDKVVVLEDVLELYDDDLEKIATLFDTEEESKNV